MSACVERQGTSLLAYESRGIVIFLSLQSISEYVRLANFYDLPLVARCWNRKYHWVEADLFTSLFSLWKEGTTKHCTITFRQWLYTSGKYLLRQQNFRESNCEMTNGKTCQPPRGTDSQPTSQRTVITRQQSTFKQLLPAIIILTYDHFAKVFRNDEPF